jgi:O-antigen/teichoic acid export membrane protein
MSNKFARIFENRLKDRHLKELLKGSYISFTFRILGSGVSYLFTLLITRNIGAEAMGIFVLSLTVLQLSSVVGRCGFDTAMLRFTSEYFSQGRLDLLKEVYTKLIKIVVPLCLLISSLLFFLSRPIAEYIFHKEHLSVYFQIVSFAVLPMVLVFINSESLRGMKKIKEYIFLQNMSIFLFAAVIISLIFLIFKEARGNFTPLIAYIVSLVTVMFLSFWMWLKSSKLHQFHSKNNINLRNVITVSLPMLFASSLMLIMQWTDTLMLGIFKSEVDVGIYNVALKVATLTSITLFAVNSIAAPKFAEFYGRNDIEGLRVIARQSTKLIFWTSLPILLLFFLFPSFILGIFGEPFKAGVYVLLFLAFGQFINSISGSVGYILQMTGKQKVFQNIILLATTINIVLNAILIPRYGINGAAFASLVSMGIWNLSSVVYIKIHFNFSTIYLPLLKT